ncbi:43225_t:CDS:2, partial [Gigaspora margarita]
MELPEDNMNIDTEEAVASKKAKTTHSIVDTVMPDTIEDSSMQLSENKTLELSYTKFSHNNPYLNKKGNTSTHKENWKNQSLKRLDTMNIQVKSREKLTSDNAQQSSHMKQEEEKEISDDDDKMDTESNSTAKDYDTNQTGHSNLTSVSHIKFFHDNPYLNKKVNTDTNEENQKSQVLKQAKSEKYINDQEDKMDTESISTIEDDEIKDEPKKKTYSKILKANETKQKSRRRYTTISDWSDKVKLKINEQRKAVRVEVFDSGKWDYLKVGLIYQKWQQKVNASRNRQDKEGPKRVGGENCATNKRVCRSGNDNRDIERNIQHYNTETKRVLKKWTLSAKRNSIQLIVMGDYNTNKEKKQNKGLVLTTLKTRGLISLLDFQGISHPTWQKGELRSQIDDFWVDTELALNMDIVKMIESKTITESNHMILKTTWHTEINLGMKQPKPTHRRKIFMYEKMVDEDWKTYRKVIEDRLTTVSKDRDTKGQSLDKKWGRWNEVIRKIANQHIPFKYSRLRQYNAISLKETKLYKNLIEISKMIKLLDKIKPLFNIAWVKSEMEKKMKKIKQLKDISIPSIELENLVERKGEVKAVLIEWKTAVWKAKNLEKNIK